MLEVVLSSIGQMAGLCILGWLLDRAGYCGDDDYKRLSKICVDVLLPLLIFHSIVSDLDTARLATLWLLPVLAFSIMAIGALVGLGMQWGLSTKSSDRRRTFVHIAAINNFGFLPIYIVANLVESGQASPDLLALLFVFNLGSTIGFWTIGVGTLAGGHLRGIGSKLLSPSIIAIVVAILVAHVDGKNWLPGVVLNTAEAAGGLSVPLMLILTGGMLRGAFNKRQTVWDLCYTTVVRNALIPIICIALACVIPMTDDMLFLWNIVAVMPAAATTPIMARVYGGSVEFSSAVLVISTILSLATVPLGLLLAQWIQ